MIYTPMTKKAIIYMFEKHKDQKDKSNIPYVYHPLHVAENLPDEITTTVALLHDVVEDTDTTFEDLKNEGFPDVVVDTLRLLTHDPNVDYFEYIKKIGTNDIARKVKLRDLEHNMDIRRINNITQADLDRVEKYRKSYDYLMKIELEKEENNNHTK